LKEFHSIDSFRADKPTVVTIGTFDGVHLGHKKIIERLVAQANISDFESVVLTFFPHPRMVIQENSDIKLLNTLSERSQVLQETGLDSLIIHPFTKEFSRLTAEEFVEQVLVKSMHTKHIIIGHDHRFGRNRTADITHLRSFGANFGFDVSEITAQEINHVAISSTKIRNALAEGKIDIANEYLGYDYMLTGTIVRGNGIGKTIGYPTANIHIAEEYKLIPKSGSYIIRSYLNGGKVFGMMNIGKNPTVNGQKQTIEVHFFDIDQDLYGQEVQISLLSYLRDEKKFPTVEILKNQLQQDKQNSLQFIASQNVR